MKAAILTVIIGGRSIARQLHVSPKTADATRRRLMNKLGISSIAELTKYAIREGITSAHF